MSIAFNEKNMPATAEDAANLIVESLDQEEIEFIKENESASVHFTVGRSLRNGWRLWEKGTPLHKHFKEKYGLSHADDMSGLILEWVFLKIKEKDFDPVAQAEKYKKYWTSKGQ